MRINLTAYMDRGTDGVEGSVTLDREDVEDLTSLAQAINDWVAGMGFSYVEDVAFAKDDGTMVWGETL